MKMSIRVLSYNCRGLRLGQSAGDKARRSVVDSLLAECDILCLQETFIAKQDLEKLNTLNENFLGVGESTTDLSKAIVRGRIPGGVAVLWDKKLDAVIKPIRLDVDWCIGIQYTYKCNNFVILNVYTPYESSENEVEYLNRLAFINAFIQDNSICSVYVVGDMNADINDSNSLFAKHLICFSEDNNFTLSSRVLLPADSYTYISEAWHSTSWLDHCFSTADGHAAIENMGIKYGVTIIDHIPLALTINIEELPSTVSNNNAISGNVSTKLDWSTLSEEDLLAYYTNTDHYLSNVYLPREAIMCKDVNCQIEEHKSNLCVMYDDVVAALLEGGKPLQKHRRNRAYNIRPGWNEHVAPYHTEAREAYKLWALAGRPRQGPELENKKLANARYKYAVRFISRNEQAMRADSMASKMMSNNITDFWKEVRSLNNCKSSLPCTVEGVSGEDNVVEIWRQHYSSLFNCLKHDPHVEDSAISNESISILTHEVFGAIWKLPNNKACGMDSITAEHLKNASLRLASLLAINFTGLLIHGILPDSMLSILLVPVIKDKAGKVGCLDNYRPIALASILSKVMERILLDRVSGYISSLDNQFGFKPNHGTDMCIYALKEIVNLYKSKNSTILMCFIDASKAFDRVNHKQLFIKLKQRGVPGYIVRVLAYWYAHQQMHIKWGGSISAPFRVSNGVRQGGILSPVLFNLYMDELSRRLNGCNTGCMIGGKLVNHLMYADDLVTFSPSSVGQQELLNICSDYGVEFDIKYNSSQSAVLICRTKQDKLLNFPVFTLANNCLEVCKKIKYLGHCIADDMNDDDDIYRQCYKLYAQANTIARKFSYCSTRVKVALFKAYCTPLYTAHLWSSYKKSSMQKLQVAYNDAMRILLKVPRGGSASQMFVSVGVTTLKALLRNLMFKFMQRLDESTNSIMVALSNPLVSCYRYTSRLRVHWLKCLYVF